MTRFPFIVGVILTLSASIATAESVPSGESRYQFTLPDHRGHQVTLPSSADSKLVVVAFLGTECPLAKLYSLRLQQIAEAYPRDQVAIIAVDSNLQDNLTEIGAFVRRQGLSYPVLKDKGTQTADLFGAERTPQVFLLDASRTIRYQGRIDDQYVIGIQRDRPSREDLKLAIDELLANKPVSVNSTPALGCLIGRLNTSVKDSTVTYSNQISRLFQKHCVACHRPGEIGPFPMLSYDDVAGWGPMIAEVVAEKRMPPWHADPHFGTFINDRSLNSEERELIATWVKNGCPEGSPAELPEPQKFIDGWQLERAPDAVVAMADKPFSVPAEGGPDGVRYQQFWVPSGFTEDRWFTGVEIRPGNRSVVHHVIVYAHADNKKSSQQEFLAAYVPGLRNTPVPNGAAKKISANSWLRFEVHYTPNGSPQEDLTEVGFIFTDREKVTHEIKTAVAISQKFKIQPMLANQKFVTRTKSLPIDVQLISMSPHMHLRGQAFEYVAEYPDGTEEVLLNVPKYDFNWQTRYCLTEPKTIKSGTVIRCTATFDNSPRNLANPDPTATVVWGDQSWEEMFLGYMDIIYPTNHAAPNATLRRLGVPAGASSETILRLTDTNQDGKISPEEAMARPFISANFMHIDQNKDGFLSEKELDEAIEKYRKSL
ncbi:redoxin domain-containing protein [Planctomicrobium sp. SH527]|uniref:redoxin domain-containing protein n=1 Tax=Planctomicrobium sp. SH527 TaxID=3448123 RepID=UPI003F5C6C35